jgi:hypothetical protein
VGALIPRHLNLEAMRLRLSDNCTPNNVTEIKSYVENMVDVLKECMQYCF